MNWDGASTRAREVTLALRDSAEEYCVGKSPWARAVLFAYLVYAGVRHIADPLYRSWFAGITLIFHEMGHVVFSMFGRTMMILGGSIMQLIVPLAAALYLLLRQGDWFGLTVGQAWLAFSTWDMATYIEDANKERLPLVSLGGGENAEHDWSTLLTQWHVLNSCDTIATLTRLVAFLVWATAISFGGWMLWKMAHPNEGDT